MKLLLPVATCIAMILSGCASAPAAVPMSAEQATSVLSQYHWRLSRASDENGKYINALFARHDKPLQLDFQNGHVHVTNACNAMNGKVVIHDDKLQVKPMIHTMMACMDPAINGLDKAISSRLEKPDTFVIDADATPPTLTLTTPDKDTLVFVGQPKQDSPSQP